MRSAKPLIITPVILLGVLIMNSWYVVGTGHVAVEKTMGNNEGVVVVIPANMQGLQMILDPKNLR